MTKLTKLTKWMTKWSKWSSKKLHGKVDQVGKLAMNFVKIVKMVMQIFISRMVSGGKEEEKKG